MNASTLYLFAATICVLGGLVTRLLVFRTERHSCRDSLAKHLANGMTIVPPALYLVALSLI